MENSEEETFQLASTEEEEPPRVIPPPGPPPPTVRGKPKCRIWKVFLAILAILVAGSVLWAFFIEPDRLRVTRHQIAVPNFKGSRPVRVVHLSDLHFEGGKRREKKLAGIVNALRPDIVVITGDFLNRPEAQEPLGRFLESIKAPDGIYAVRGNWDLVVKPYEALRRGGVTLLENRWKIMRIADAPFHIVGLGYPKVGYLPRLLPKKKPGVFRIVLYHTPEIARDIAQYPFDLCLVGHTHGGQVRLPFLGAAVRLFIRRWYKYDAGLHPLDGKFLYVNRGVGMSGVFPPARFLCPPEVALFEIGPPQAK